MAYHVEPMSSPQGNWGKLAIRDGTSDLSVALSTLGNHWEPGGDEYQLKNRRFSGVFVDVGAHIGAVTLAVLLDNPVSKAILVEPIAENVELIKATIEANDWPNRATVVKAAVGRSDIRLGTTQDDRYVGNIGHHDGEVRRVRVVTLLGLVKMAGGYIDALKTDCEGGEWGLFASGGLNNVGVIFGEWHGHNRDFIGPERLHQALDKTHVITDITDDGGVGLFWAVPR